MAHRFAFFFVSTCALVAGSRPTVALADEAADIAAARILGGDGVNLADSGNCEQAVEKLERAEKLHHAPTTAARLGECEIELGKLVAGTERLQRILRAPLPPNAPPVFVDSLVRARGVLERSVGKVPALRVSVHAPLGAKVHVTIDGDSLPEVLFDNDCPTDPGAHKVVAAAAGYRTSYKDVALSEGETRSVVLVLEPDPRLPAPQEGAVHPSSVTPPPLSHAKGSAAPVVAFALGGGGLAVGAASGIVVALDSANLSKSCVDWICQQTKQPEISSAKTWASVSTVGFGIAGAGVAAGIILLLTDKSESRSPTPQGWLRPVVSPTYLGMDGQF